MTLKCGLSALLVAATSTLAFAQGASNTTPTFKTQIEYVEVDVVITDQVGTFARGLSRDDFQVFEDGKRQDIVNFALVDLPLQHDAPSLSGSAAIEPDVRGNEQPFDGRIYVMLLDDLHVDAGRTQSVRTAARQFIRQYVGANDLMAVISTGGNSQGTQNLTSSKRLLTNAVDAFVGQKLQSLTRSRNEQAKALAAIPGAGAAGSGLVSDDDDRQRADTAQSTVMTLQQVAEWLGGVHGRRKTLLFFSEGIDYDLTDLIRGPTATPSAAPRILDDIREALSATARTNVSIYSIDPRGLTSMDDGTIDLGPLADNVGVKSAASELRLQQDSLRQLAEDSGGLAIVDRNDYRGAFERIVADNSRYYVLGYYPPSNKRDGKYHRIEVRSLRPGLSVRARRGYAAPRGKAPAAAKGGGLPPDLLEAINSPLPVGGLSMRVFAAPFKGASANASVLVGVEMLGRHLTLENGKVNISYRAIDAKSKVFEARNDTLTLNLPQDTRMRVATTGVRLLNRMDLPPGRYQLRIAARDAGKATRGSVIYDLDVPDFWKTPFAMSGLTLTSLASGALMTARADDQMRRVLPAAPVSQRMFAQSDELALFAEIYESAKRVAHKIDVTTSVIGDDGRVLYKSEDTHDSSEADAGAYGYTARLPLSEITPGTYVLQVEAKSRLEKELSATRQIQITIVPAGR